MRIYYKSFLLIGLFALLTWTVEAQQRKRSGVAGSARGRAFSTTCNLQSLKEIRIQAGDWIDGIQIVCKTATNRIRGGNGGELYRFTLRSGEQIRRISGTFGTYVNTLQIFTNQRTSRVFGKKAGPKKYSFSVPSGYQFVGFRGRADQYLHAIGLVYQRAGTNGGETGNTGAIELFVPRNKVTMDNGCNNGQSNTLRWDFTWSRQAAARRYHLMVWQNGKTPRINNTNISTNRYTTNTMSVIMNRAAFYWKVRAWVNGHWTAWSNTRTFNVEPVNSDCRGGNTSAVGSIRLTSPRNNAVLDNGCTNRTNRVNWGFAWQKVNGASYYHLMVYKPGKNPFINIQKIQRSSYLTNRRSYVSNSNRFGWKWKVRAFVNNRWTNWSTERTFNVEPVNTDCKSTTTANSNNGTYKVIFRNSSIFIAKYRLVYYVNGQKQVIKTGDKSPGWKKTYYVPAKARNIKVVIRYKKQLTWTELYSNITGKLTRNDCFNVKTKGILAILSRGGCN